MRNTKNNIKDESSVEKYNLLYEFAPMAYFTLNRKSTILEVNLAGSILMSMNRSSLVNTNFRNFIEDRQGFDHYLENLFRGMKKESCELTIISPGKPGKAVLIEGKVSPDHTSCLLAAADITERKKQELKIREEAQRAKVLAELSAAFTEAGSRLSDIFDILARSITTNSNDLCIINVMSHDGKWLIPTIFYHPEQEVINKFRPHFPYGPVKLGEGIAGQVAQNGVSRLIDFLVHIKRDAGPDEPGSSSSIWEDALKYMVIPMKTQGQVVGTLGLLRLKAQVGFTPEEQEFAEVVANRVAMAITNIQLYEDLQQSLGNLENKVMDRTSELSNTLIKLAYERKRFSEVLDIIPSYVILINHDHQIVFMNKVFRKMYRKSASRYCYARIEGKEKPCDPCPAATVFDRGIPVTIERKLSDGKIFQISDFPFKDADGTSLILEIGTDVTLLRQAENDRVARRAAEQANQYKSHFIARVSHDIKTPMNAILGFSDLLSRTITDEKQKAQVNAIQTSSALMLKLINDILDISNIETGTVAIHPEPVDILVIINELKKVYSQQAAHKGVLFNVKPKKEVSFSVMIDEVILTKILSNLLDNAIKYTDKGEINFTFSKSMKSPDRADLTFTIEDTGIGFSKELREQIFYPVNHKRGSVTNGPDELGLGLSVTIKLTKLMGGTIELTSKPEKGSKFSVNFPGITVIREFDRYAAEEELDPGKIRFKPCSILIADDDAESRNLLADILGYSPVEIIQAKNGLEAVELTLRKHPSLVLMDLMMPELDGLEAARLLKKRKATKEIPLIGISASPEQAIFNNKVIGFFDDFIQKPFSLGNLIRSLMRFLDYEGPEVSLTSATPARPEPISGEQTGYLINKLKVEFLPVYHEITAKNELSKIEQFGRELESLGAGTGSRLVEDYGIAIRTYAINCDIEHLLKKLRAFPGLVDHLKNNKHK